MKTKASATKHSMNRTPYRVTLLFIPLALACFALSPQAQAMDAQPDGGYPNRNTAEREDALSSLTPGADNTAMRFDALESDTTGSDQALASWIWRRAGTLNTNHYAHTATLLQNGLVLVAGGIELHFNAHASAELYDPASRTWTATGSLDSKRYLHTATLLQNGMVLIVGGFDTPDGGIISARAELYDPASGTWTSTGSLDTARYAHTATLLPNGMVLVAGGVGNTNPWLASAELYDPASGIWTGTGNLNIARVFHTATLLPNGMVLVAGGNDIHDNNSASAGTVRPGERNLDSHRQTQYRAR